MAPTTMPEYDPMTYSQRELTRRLKEARNPSQLLEEMKAKQDDLNYYSLGSAAVNLGHQIRDVKQNKYLFKKTALAYRFILKKVQEQIEDIDSQAVANILWSLGRATEIRYVKKQIRNFDQMFAMLLDIALEKRHDMIMVNLANVLWAMAKYRWKNREQFKVLLETILELDILTYEPQDVSICLWSLAAMQYNDEKAILHFLNSADQCVGQMRSQGLVSIIWSMKELRYFDLELMRMIQNIILDNRMTFRGDEIATIVMSLTDFGMCNPNVVRVLIDQYLGARLRKSGGFATLVYGLAVAKQPVWLAQKLVAEFVTEKFKTRENVPNQVYSQLRRAQLFYQGQGQELMVPEEVEEKCIKIQKQLVESFASKPYQFLETVYEKICERFPQAQKRSIVMDGEIEINIEVVEGEIKVAVMLLSTSSFTTSLPPKLMGRPKAYFSMLESFGWKVVAILESDWDQPGFQDKVQNRIDQLLGETQNDSQVVV